MPPPKPTKPKPKSKPKNQPPKVNFWQMVRDVLIASMNKGQFPMALVGMLLLALIEKMPSGDVSQLVFQIVSDLEHGYLLGYAGAVLACGGWFFHAKFQRRVYTEEISRVAKERTALQKERVGALITSSD